MKNAVVYAITHDPTGARYVGSTTKAVFYRIGQHLADLKKGVHSSKKLQRLWANSAITEWSFKVLEILNTGRHRARFSAEKKWLDRLTAELRLNDNNRLQSYDKYSEVLRRIKSGERYVDISAAVNLSIGMITQIKKLGAEGVIK